MTNITAKTKAKKNIIKQRSVTFLKIIRAFLGFFFFAKTIKIIVIIIRISRDFKIQNISGH